METIKCGRCGSELPGPVDLAICHVCKNALASEIKASAIISLVFVILSIIIALTGFVFFLVVASRGGDPSSVRSAGPRGVTWTPKGMLILCGCMLLAAIGMFIVSEVIKKTSKKKEEEYLKFTGEELKHDYESILP
jgi:hypothetical protein